MTTHEKAEPHVVRSAGSIALVVCLAFGLVVCIGIAFGFFKTVMMRALSPADLALGMAIVATTAACAWQLIVRTRHLIGGLDEPAGPSVRKGRSLWTFFIAVGLVIGIALPLAERSANGGHAVHQGLSLFRDAPIAPGWAVFLLLALIAIAIATPIYYRTVDEHEYAAQSDASVVALNFYFLSSLAWSIAAKGSLAPAVDYVIVFFATLTTFVVVWLWRKVR